MKEIAERNIRIQTWVNFLCGAVFLVPIVTLFYKYTGLDLFEIIIVANVSSACVWLLEIPTSVFSDTMGHKKALLYSVIANFFGAILILLFPSLAGFIIASIFSALYFSFWSGTGQAFLDENLKILNKQEKFGKFIGGFMFYEQLATLLTPLLASLILKIYGDAGFTILAGLDVIFAFAIVILVMQLKSVNTHPKSFKSIKHLFNSNLKTAKDALKNVFQNTKLKTLLIYRSLANHVAFFPIILLPILSEKGMPTWFSGILMAIATIGSMITMKYAYKLGEKYKYRTSWIISTIAQAVLLIIAGLLFKWWILVAIIYVIFNTFEGLWQPSWNHVLVTLTRGKAIATTRSIIFSVFALYTTLGKQILVMFDVQYALIGLGIFILLANVVFGRKMMKI